MKEESNEGQEKPRYEAPELISLGETVRGIAICEIGSTASGGDECTDGEIPDAECADGIIPL
jgi:hypothetical protein